RVLGEDRDALLALEVHRIEHTLGHVLVRAERTRLPQHRVDERRLPVVDVRDDRDVAELVAGDQTGFGHAATADRDPPADPVNPVNPADPADPATAAVPFPRDGPASLPASAPASLSSPAPAPA